MSLMKRFYITTPIYYVNARPHIGHTYTTIAADVFARYYRLKLGAENVFFLTGTDEHGSKIYQKSREAGKEPKQFCDEVSDIFKEVWKRYLISNSSFIRTTDLSHINFVKEFIVKIKEAGALYEDTYEGLYCVGCEKFVTEKDLVEGKCPDHMTTPEFVKEKNWFFDLQKYLPKIVESIESGALNIFPESAKKEVIGLIKHGIPNFSVTRDAKKVQWGIPVPWDDTQLIYVWCDALSNYVSAVQNTSWWPATMHLMGKDILKFHAVYWPALLMSVGMPLPESICAHGFFTVNGQKMSKTLGNVIDPIEMTDTFGVDASRYLLLSQFPFGQDGDIQKNRFIEKYNSDLSNGIGNLLNRVLALVEKWYDSSLTYNSLNKELRTFVDKAMVDYVSAMEEKYRLDLCLDSVFRIVSFCDKLISDIRLWEIVKSDSDKGAFYLSNLLETLRIISLMLSPFMPNISSRIYDQLGILPEEHSLNVKPWSIRTYNIKKGDILFNRL